MTGSLANRGLNAVELPAEPVVIVRQDASNTRESVDRLEEIHLLTESAGGEVVATVLSKRKRPDSVTFVGKGKAEEIRDLVAATGAELVIIDHAITPVQERNLERRVKCRVIDRTRLILDIFSHRASSREGKLQVELAQLKHLSTRLVRGWTHLERQKGGIGLRGPGETQLEMDRRLIGIRIKTLTKRLNKIQIQRENRRSARSKIPVSTVALVGYTNAGKSSLFNRLSGALVDAENRLFSTLDTTMRKLELPGYGPVILSDTVGFIRNLPHGLISAFRATLEEVSNASVLLHVIDASRDNIDELIEDVQSVLEEIGASDVPVIMVFNKMDLVNENSNDAALWFDTYLPNRQDAVHVSAQTGEGLDELFDALGRVFKRHHVFAQVRIPPQAGRLRAEIYQHLGVSSETITDTGETVLDLELSPRDIGWLNSVKEFKDEYWQIRPQ